MSSGTVGSWDRPVLESWSSLCSLCDLRPLPESQPPHITLELSITHTCVDQTGLVCMEAVLLPLSPWCSLGSTELG